MARRLRLRSGDLAVTARLAMPAGHGGIGVVLAHGAGAGQDHPWMVAMREGLAGTGLPTMTFNYAYTEAGRSSPDRAPKLLAVHTAALERMRTYVDRVVLAGKSMGGRMASHLGASSETPVDGLVYYGYPLVPMGRGEPRSTDHLERVAAPQLFFSGTRDRLSPPQLVGEVVRRLERARLIVVDDADHSFRVPKRTGRSDEAVLGELAAVTYRWICAEVLGQPDGGGV